MTEPAPIACDLAAIDEEQRGAHRRAAEAVFEAIVAVDELPDGYAFRFPSDTDVIARAGAFIARERLCCPFFNFVLEVERDGGPGWLKLTGREGVKEYVRDTVLPLLESETGEA